MRKLIFILTILTIISPSVLGKNFNVLSKYDYNNYNSVQIQNITNLYSQACSKKESIISFNEKSGILKEVECFGDDQSTDIMFRYQLEKKENNLALSYDSFQIGVTFEVKKHDLGNGNVVVVHKPKIKANFRGEIEP